MGQRQPFDRHQPGQFYDSANRRTCLTLPNGVLASYSYDKDSRVTSLVYGTGGSCSSPPNNLGSLTYSYDADGRRTATAGSLATVTLPANVTGTTSYNADNEQSTFNGTSLSYDANGNLTSAGIDTYTWDARNHLTAISGNGTATFTYDGFGRRASKTITGSTTQFLYDGLNPVQELNGSNGIAANLLTGLGIDEYFTRIDNSNNLSTFLADALGSTIAVVTTNNGQNPNATVYQYEPFGGTTTGGSANGNPYQFTGRENDGTGLYFYRARYYRPTFQRFIAQDPIGFGGGDANLYGYVWNEPANLFDPSGLLGGGVAIGGEFGAGLGSAAVGGSVSAGGGYFTSGGWGGFASGGALGLGPKLNPPCPGDRGYAFGSYAGGGANIFVTTADNVSELAGPFRTYSFSVGLGVRLINIQYSVGRDAAGDTIRFFSFSPPVPFPTGFGDGVSYSLYNTNTLTTGGGGTGCTCH